MLANEWNVNVCLFCGWTKKFIFSGCGKWNLYSNNLNHFNNTSLTSSEACSCSKFEFSSTNERKLNKTTARAFHMLRSKWIAIGNLLVKQQHWNDYGSSSINNQINIKQNVNDAGYTERERELFPDLQV